MIGKLGGHAGHVMALLLLGKEEPYLMLTGSLLNSDFHTSLIGLYNTNRHM
jgi:hypothetical protein